MLAREDALPIANDLAERWGFAEMEELPSQCGYVFTDKLWVLKIPRLRSQGVLESAGLERFAASGVFPNLYAYDVATGSFASSFIAGENPDVLHYLGAIRQLVDRIATTPIYQSTPPSPWPRIGRELAPHHQHLIDTQWQKATWDDSMLGPLRWRHGDLWHENLILRPTGEMYTIDPVPSVGPVLHDAVELATRCLAYQHPRDQTVIRSVAEVFEVNPTFLRAGIAIFAAVQFVLHEQAGRTHKANAYADLLRWLDPKSLPS